MYTQSFSKYLDRFGDYAIQKITVCRVPLSKSIMALLNVASGNEFQKNLDKTPYDKLYHLFMKIQIADRFFILEKNEVLSFKPNERNIKAESIEIDIGSSMLTLVKALDKTKQVMGGKFFSYKPQDNNCQFFIQSFLDANGLGSSESENFIMQNVNSLFDQDTRFRKLVNTVTAVGKVIAENKTVDKLRDSKSIGEAIRKVGPRLKIVQSVHNGLATGFPKIKF